MSGSMKVKIISNPYSQQIRYQNCDNVKNTWSDVSDENSSLISKELTQCFLPFKVSEILDAIIKEYHGYDELTVVFEGTDDEYDAVRRVCGSEEYSGKVRLERSDRILRNARDIIKDVEKEFKYNVKPIMDGLMRNNEDLAAKIKQEKDKFDDVSKSTIPICVVGNYSSGKSSFINALIGEDLLPSGDSSLTAKIHRIERSDDTDRASVSFEFESRNICYSYRNNECTATNTNASDPLFGAINEELEKVHGGSAVTKIAAILKVINNYDKKHKEETVARRVSDLIKISIPFNAKGIFGNYRNEYVLFDTPGSNSATNSRHLQVLQQQMRGMSNGLIMYVCKYDDLDSMDNDKLCSDIINMKGLDKRFAMIIVNRADEAHFGSEYSEDEVMSQMIPHKLYSGGLYFVSSIMGLGSKKRFSDQNNEIYTDIFEMKRERYCDPAGKYYTKLYEYNIVPASVRDEMISSCESRNETESERIYANSGLYWVENEIETFAHKYSPYNKCWQSALFLKNIIDLSSEAIENKTTKLKKDRERLDEKLDENRKELIKSINDTCKKLTEDYKNDYDGKMKPVVRESAKYITADELKDIEKKLSNDKKQNSEFDKTVQESKDAGDQIKEMFGDVFGRKSSDEAVKENIKTMPGRFVKLVGKGITSKIEAKNISDKIDLETSEEVMQLVNKKYRDYLLDAFTYIDNGAEKVWNKNKEDMKAKLAEIVANSPTLPDEKKYEIQDAIMNYPLSDELNEYNRDFDIKNFKHKLVKIGVIKIFGNNKLKTGKLEERFKSALDERIKPISDKVKDNHSVRFTDWRVNLENNIISHIDDLNDDLKDLLNSISDNKKNIKRLELDRKQLDDSLETINELMESYSIPINN